MKTFLTTIKYDYLQRTRSYAFLITLCTSLAIAYTFVPEPNASYSTIRIADYVGFYNSAWFGYVTAIMTSVFLSLIGFYLVNSGIKRDSETKIGQVIAATSVSNFKYLLYKTLSNFLVLMTIVCIVFLMSILLFFLYNDGFPFELLQFVKPYVFITLPAMFFVAMLAVLFEVLFGKYSVLQNVGFFFLFSALMVVIPKNESQFAWDAFGNKIVIHKMEETVQEILQTDKSTDLSIGYVIENTKQVNKFDFNGIAFPLSFIISRFLWILGSIILIALIAPIFHRFNRKGRIALKKPTKETEKILPQKEINISNLVVPKTNYSILPLLRTELVLLIRKGKNWLWLLNLIGMALLVVLPIKISYQMVLPILWFLQIGRISDITTKENSNNVNHFTSTSYKPIGRLLVSQLLSGYLLLLFLALPLIIRLTVMGNFISGVSITIGCLFIVVLAAMLGLLSNGKKLFEILFFMITYANINGITFADYFGGFEHQSMYNVKLTACILILTGITFVVRKDRLQK